MKKCIIIWVYIMMLLLPSLPVFAQEQAITVTINGKMLVCDTVPQLVNDRTMLPLRAVFEGLGAKVSWIEADQIIMATKNDTLITLKIGVPEMSIQTIGSGKNIAVSLDVAPFIDVNRTLVPVRAVSEALKAKVDWVTESRTVVITTE